MPCGAGPLPGHRFVPFDNNTATRMLTLIDGALGGGVSYAIDPALKEPPRGRPTQGGECQCHARACSG